MPSVGKDTIEFSAKVPASTYEEFKILFPQYGAVNWFINTALAQFLEQVKKHPTSVQNIDGAIAEMLARPRESQEPVVDLTGS